MVKNFYYYRVILFIIFQLYHAGFYNKLKVRINWGNFFNIAIQNLILSIKLVGLVIWGR